MNKSLGKRFDKQVSNATDFTARRITRRESLKRLVRGSAVVAAGVAVGSLSSIKPAMAVTCSCSPPHGRYCSGCPYNGCPSGGSICYDFYPGTGSWVACSGFGRCHQGFYLCYDCNTRSGHCYCGCKTGLLCGQCCSPADVKAEMGRLQQAAMAAS